MVAGRLRQAQVPRGKRWKGPGRYLEGKKAGTNRFHLNTEIMFE